MYSALRISHTLFLLMRKNKNKKKTERKAHASKPPCHVMPRWVTRMQFWMHLTMALLRRTEHICAFGQIGPWQCAQAVQSKFKKVNGMEKKTKLYRMNATAFGMFHTCNCSLCNGRQLIKWFYVSFLNCKLSWRIQSLSRSDSAVSIVLCPYPIGNQFTKMRYEFPLTTVVRFAPSWISPLLLLLWIVLFEMVAARCTVLNNERHCSSRTRHNCLPNTGPITPNDMNIHHM